jgi:hypothetical protein
MSDARDRVEGDGMRARRVDGNQNEIVELLREIPGCSVAITSAVGDGFVDIVVGYRGFNFMFELKDPSKPKADQELTDEQHKFHSAWRGQIQKVCSLKEIITAMTGWSGEHRED